MYNPYKTATFWNRLVLCVPKVHFGNNSTSTDAPTHPGEWLKHYRSKNNISRNELLGHITSTHRQLSTIELCNIYPNENLSKQLASYFNLKTIYFHDEYLEYVNHLDLKIKNYRLKNNLSQKQLAHMLDAAAERIIKWEKGTKVSRKYYLKLKKLGI